MEATAPKCHNIHSIEATWNLAINKTAVSSQKIKKILTVDRKEGIVDGDDGGVGVVEGGAHDETADAAKSVDTDLDGHGCF